MEIVLFTALGVGGATVFGAVVGFFTKKITDRFYDAAMALAAGVMLAAAVIGLILPALEYGGLIAPIGGIFAGALCMEFLERCVIRLERSADVNRVILFVAAIAIHNLPEGLAAGVSFGTGDSSAALLIAGGIALQNIPEGMVIISPMLSTGMSPKQTLLWAFGTGLIEVIGTFLGYFAVNLSAVLLPFALSFAGGTMLYVICDEMVPHVHKSGRREVTYALLIGFCLMLIFDRMLG